MHSAAVTYFCALALVVLMPFCGGGIDRPPITDVSSEAVTYETEDGVRIAAGFFPPPGVTKPPAVILLHEAGATRAQWDVPLIPILVKEGYAVLAPDIRGHGESTTVMRDGQPQPYQFSGSAADALPDVKAAIEWLKGQGNVDASRLGVVGSRLGAMLAYASTALFPEVKAAVAITVPPYDPDNLDPLYAAIPDFDSHDVFFMAGALRAWEEAATVGVRVDGLGGDRYEDHSELDGVALLTIDKPIEDIKAWFEPRVLSTTTPVASAVETGYRLATGAIGGAATWPNSVRRV